MSSSRWLPPLTLSRRGHDFPDPLVKVYDLRNMRPLPPVPFSDGPAFINLLPMHTSTLVVTSAQGLVNVVDVSNTNASDFYHVRLSFLPPFSSDPWSARHDLVYHIYRRFIQWLLPGIWRCNWHNPSPHCRRRLLRALLQWLPGTTSRMGRRPRTTPRNKLDRCHVRTSLLFFISFLHLAV